MYVHLQDNLRLTDITSMYVEEFNLFCSLSASYKTEFNFLYNFTYDIIYPNKNVKNNGFVV